tara:strand:+ start:414 stop:629 length:216 start_codon:yes stop_codon:yes gene_type:complete
VTASLLPETQQKLLEAISDLEFLKEDLHKTSDINNMDASDMIQIEKIAESIKNQRSLIGILLYNHGLGQED